MALRDQPYIPLYIQDYLTDERLNMCSWSTQGIYIKIMCVLHKQDEYGSILFKQNSKQSSSSIEYFASVFVKNLPCQLPDMISAITELIENEVLYIDSNGLHQKRMKKDGQTSLKRSKAAKDGGGNPNLFKQTVKQTVKQNTEYENVIETDIDNKLKRAFDEIYMEQQKMKWPHLDFDFEYRTFCEKVRGSPTEYQHRDSGGLRLAFQYQLRTSKGKLNGKFTSKTDTNTADLAAKLAKRIYDRNAKGNTNGGV